MPPHQILRPFEPVPLAEQTVGLFGSALTRLFRKTIVPPPRVANAVPPPVAVPPPMSLSSTRVPVVTDQCVRPAAAPEVVPPTILFFRMTATVLTASALSNDTA